MLTFTGSTYAFWTLTKTQDDSNVVIGKCLKLSFSDASSTTSINLNDTYPVFAGDAMASNDNTYSFTITNNCEHEENYIIGLENTTSGTNVVPYASISYAIDEMPMGTLASRDDIDSTTTGNDGKELYYGTVPAKSGEVAGTVTHTFKMWVNETSTLEDNDKDFDSKLFVRAGQDDNGNEITSKRYLALEMKENADTTTVIDFTKTSDEVTTDGIYVTNKTDSGSNVYYYRGEVDNNLVFGGFCWKIIRTTETGGVKIIYNGVAASDNTCSGAPYINESTNNGIIQFNQDWTDNSFINYNGSNAQNAVDTWFANNILAANNTIEDTVYCNLRNLVATGVCSYRLEYDDDPNLACKNKTGNVSPLEDAFTVSSLYGNGDLTYPVALITRDEIMLAGVATYGKSYLFIDEDKMVLTMSPGYSTNCEFHSDVIAYNNDGMDTNNVITGALRPVISLKAGTEIASGDGTAANPYVVK